MISSKEFLQRRKKLVLQLRDLVIKRMDINFEIKSAQKELKSLDNFLLTEDVKKWR